MVYFNNVKILQSIYIQYIIIRVKFGPEIESDWIVVFLHVFEKYLTTVLLHYTALVLFLAERGLRTVINELGLHEKMFPWLVFLLVESSAVTIADDVRSK